jgi:uncharacterized MnhB-related membrane protein
MGNMKEYLMTFLGVCVSLIIINNVSFLKGIVFNNYTGTTSAGS